MGTTRLINDNVLIEMQRRIRALNHEIDVIQNSKSINVPVFAGADLPPANEGDFAMVSDDETGYVYINGAWVQVGGGTGGGGTDDPPWDAVITKAADESVTSAAAFQDDNELLFTTTNGVTYMVEVMVLYASPAGGATPDIHFIFGEDATNRGYLIGLGYSTADAQNNLFLDGNTVSIGGNFGTATTKRIVNIRGTYTGGGGTAKLRWAQNTINANATTVYAGSYLRYRSLS